MYYNSPLEISEFMLQKAKKQTGSKPEANNDVIPKNPASRFQKPTVKRPSQVIITWVQYKFLRF
jgi:hypothetical protein